MRTALTRALMVGTVALTVALAGCSGGAAPSGSDDQKELATFSFQLNNPPNGSNSGFAAAVEQGFYADAGLDVKIEPGTGSSQTVQMVAAGQGAKIGYADSTATTQLIAQGAPLVVLATVYQSNPNEVIALSDSGIDSIADLKGKKVGTPVPSSQASMLPLFLEANGLSSSDVELINLAPTSLVQSLLQHQVDAILGSIDTYQVQLEQQGATDLFTAMFADSGVPTVSTSIFAQRDYIEQNPELVSAFVRASLQGWEYATSDPEGAVADVTALWGQKASVTTAEELDAILAGNLLCAGGARFVGRAEPEQWELTQDLLSQVELLPIGIDPTDYYTYDFLPPDGELQSCPIG